MKTKVFLRLKPKTASLGFNEAELQGVAAQVATNLGSENATDEEIDAAIDAVIPLLSLSQSAANRVINANKAKEDAEKAKTKSEEATDSAKRSIEAGAATPSEDLGKQIQAAVTAAISPIAQELATLKAQDVTASRRTQLEAVIKDAGVLSDRIIKDFSRMNFDTDVGFSEYLEETKADVASFKQERADVGLGAFPKPIIGGGSSKAKPTEAELDGVLGKI